MISFIAAFARDHVMGNNNQLPWRLPNDLQFFKKVTSDHTIVMGRRTYDSIGHPLPHRRNVVLTSQTDFIEPNVEVIHNKEAVLELAKDEEIFIIGGAEVFQQFMAEVDHLYLTIIDANFPGDTFFPEWDPAQFDLICQLRGEVDEENPYPHTFYIYERKEDKDDVSSS